jgi:UDP-glucuronate 4-epimerase
MKILITGAAGFIGNELAVQLSARGDDVFGIDNLNNYYDVSLKRARLARLDKEPHFRFKQLDISDRSAMTRFFLEHHFDVVINLAAQAGVRSRVAGRPA